MKYDCCIFDRVYRYATLLRDALITSGYFADVAARIEERIDSVEDNTTILQRQEQKWPT